MKGCKDCPAYAKCTVTYRGSACAALRGTYGLDSDPQIITNADRIRAMSDEELAEMLFDYKECGKNCIMSSGKHCYQVCEEESTILKWLQQPAKEDEHEISQP